MTVEMLEARVQELEQELAEAKDALNRSLAPEPKLFRDLYGIIQSQDDLTMEDFEAVKLRMNWDKFKDI